MFSDESDPERKGKDPNSLSRGDQREGLLEKGGRKAIDEQLGEANKGYSWRQNRRRMEVVAKKEKRERK